MNRHVERGQMLIDTHRYAEAKKQISLGLAEDPQDPIAHMLLGICHANLKEYDAAIEHAEFAVHQVPDSANTHGVLAAIYLQADKYKDAKLGAEQALRLDPSLIMAMNVLASVHAHYKNWAEARRMAEMALSYKPDDIEAMNLRALALRSMGESGASIDELTESLKVNAEDATSHANLGWTYLQSGKLDKAEIHFREALRINPNLEWARVGALETLKAKVPVYRWILGYFMWMATKTAGMQWAIVIGLLIGYRVVFQALVNNPATEGLAYVVMGAYLLFCVTTWFAGPISDALVVLHPFGRLALTRWERLGGFAVGSAIVLTIGCLVANFFMASEIGLVLALCIGFTAIPMAMMFQIREGMPRKVMAITTVVAAGLALGFGVGAIYGLENLPLAVASLCERCTQAFIFVPLGTIVLANVLSSYR
ncbi:tetratricopeptide repeat protein [Bremerella cremea]|uniref:tetratricopeptide repeat protein n=1 Tax=Bremerella cremea TaxID=1031537 RepID=UPI0031E8009E